MQHSADQPDHDDHDADDGESAAQPALSPQHGRVVLPSVKTTEQMPAPTPTPAPTPAPMSARMIYGIRITLDVKRDTEILTKVKQTIIDLIVKWSEEVVASSGDRVGSDSAGQPSNWDDADDNEQRTSAASDDGEHSLFSKHSCTPNAGSCSVGVSKTTVLDADTAAHDHDYGDDDDDDEEEEDDDADDDEARMKMMTIMLMMVQVIMMMLMLMPPPMLPICYIIP